jgi:hypothetical protein
VIADLWRSSGYCAVAQQGSDVAKASGVSLLGGDVHRRGRCELVGQARAVTMTLSPESSPVSAAVWFQRFAIEAARAAQAAAISVGGDRPDGHISRLHEVSPPHFLTDPVQQNLKRRMPSAYRSAEQYLNYQDCGFVQPRFADFR